MPVAAIQNIKRVSFPYIIPPSGKVRITVEASIPVDIFVVKQGDENFCSSVALATQHGIFTLPQRKIEDQNLTLPESWRPNNWVLVIGNPSPNVAAVYYNVFNV
jgi:hypothetical protein